MNFITKNNNNNNFTLIEKCGTSGLICLNSGTCGLSPIDHISHVCTCSAGFTGDDCSAVVCGTDGNACYNDGYCNETTSTCVCPRPLTSEDCRGSQYNLSRNNIVSLFFL